MSNPQTGTITSEQAADLMKESFMAKVLHCKRCGYEWVGRINPLPRCCSKCKSHQWQTPRQ